MLNIYNKLLQMFVKEGKSTSSKKSVVFALTEISLKNRINIKVILIKVFLKLNSFVEAKTVLIKRRKHVIPFSINLNRRCYLIYNWINKAIIENNKKCSYSAKLGEEIVSLLYNYNSSSLKSKKETNKQSQIHRSNIHYRW
jgi:ribosomal protein S7